jgi:hypothetical protein
LFNYSATHGFSCSTLQLSNSQAIRLISFSTLQLLKHQAPQLLSSLRLRHVQQLKMNSSRAQHLNCRRAKCWQNAGTRRTRKKTKEHTHTYAHIHTPRNHAPIHTHTHHTHHTHTGRTESSYSSRNGDSQGQLKSCVVQCMCALVSVTCVHVFCSSWRN